MSDYFSNSRYGLTGGNYRERPYVRILPKLTTKSNTFTVHYRVQALKQVNRGTSATWNTWDETEDIVKAEQRGSYTIERYIDPNDPRLVGVDFADPDEKRIVEDFYQFRIIDHKIFAP